MNSSNLSLDDIRNFLNHLPGPDTSAAHLVIERDLTLTKPLGSLGKLEEIAIWLASWTGCQPKINYPLVAIFSSNHGVTKQGISRFSPEVTAQMVTNFRNGGAAINQICIANNLNLKVLDLRLERPTADISQKAAMDEPTCAESIDWGMESISIGTDLLCIGEMGIGNTTIASAIYYALFGGTAEDWVGPGTGLDTKGIALKVDVINRAVKLHKKHLNDSLEVLCCLGGREIAAMVGAILAGRLKRIPVVIDGFVASAAAALLYAFNSKALDHCLFGHLSAEPAHLKALKIMNKIPLLDLGMRLGEGTGAALAAGIIRAAAQCHSGMATFPNLP
ncbi:nicotinate-nucleotide--dimethylbenzimidazole phosphoribosyltransferase [Candidatus Endowatersipora endosymbiont of Watersipora subatra]|uniref:nicotinate-nucleotide--dimethylbenzimidazole phosphoribosyltransferase n=1 Tax=Candidatus Endowatersipora endosymbiont of Watersipora subatra TaxID=3077946 RepID=UPI00312CB638